MIMKTQLMLGGAFGGMTANERRLGRFIRDGEGHPAPVAPATPAATPPATDPSESDDFSAFESNVDDAGDDDDNGSGSVEPAPSGNDDGDAEEPPAPQDPEGASVQKRIDELTAARREAERDAAEARRELEQLRAHQPPKKEDTRSEGEAPNPDDYEFGEADSRFIADTATFYANQAYERRAREAEATAQLREVESRWAGAISNEEIVQQYPDFQEKVTEGANKGSWDCSPLMALMIKSSDVGPHIAYHLASNAAESKRIAGMVPIEQALEIGRLEGRLAAEKSAKSPAAPRVASNAPPPPQRTRGAGGKFAVEADTDDFAAFDKYADGMIKTK